jgi:hypothetical protein
MESLATPQITPLFQNFEQNLHNFEIFASQYDYEKTILPEVRISKNPFC